MSQLMDTSQITTDMKAVGSAFKEMAEAIRPLTKIFMLAFHVTIEKTPQAKTHSANRTTSSRRRAGSRRTKRYARCQ